MNLYLQYHMQLAIEIASRGLYTTSPNPNVGCVIVKRGNIIALGYHYKAGMPHAEIYAIEMAGNNISGADMFVTLEPCCHFGKTPPCVNKIITSGIKRVFIGMQDPYLKVSGKGIAALKSAGIEVITGILEAKVRELNLGFISRTQYNKPWITLKVGSSLDSKIALSDRKNCWVGDREVIKDVHYLRAKNDVIIIDTETINKDNPRLTIENIDINKQPAIIVIDRQLKTNYKSNIYSSNTRVILVTNHNNDTDLFKNKQINIWDDISNNSGIDINKLIKRLTKENYNYALIEATTALNSQFLRLNLIDEIIVYIAPKFLNRQAKKTFNLPYLEELEDRLDFYLHNVKEIGSRIKLTLRKI